MFIDYNEQKALLKSIEEFIFLDLGHDLKKLRYRIDCQFMDPEGVNALSIYFEEHGDNLYIKFGDLDKKGIKEIEISRIIFKKTRKGYGTLLLSRLVDLAVKYNYSEICIHAANENSTAFGENFGFKTHGNSLYVTVADLKSNLLAHKQANSSRT